jgi:hypothetical protein
MAKEQVEKRKPNGVLDYFSLAVTTCGVGYLPLMPGTYGSMLGAGFYLFLATTFRSYRYSSDLAAPEFFVATIHAVILIAFLPLLSFGNMGSVAFGGASREYRRSSGSCR